MAACRSAVHTTFRRLFQNAVVRQENRPLFFNKRQKRLFLLVDAHVVQRRTLFRHFEMQSYSHPNIHSSLKTSDIFDRKINMIAKKLLTCFQDKKCAVKNECSVNIWHDPSPLCRRRLPLLPLALAIGDKELPSGSHEPVDELGNAEQAHAGEEAKSASCKGGKEYLANTAMKKNKHCFKRTSMLLDVESERVSTETFSTVKVRN